jgi:hypothetical protein
MLSQTRRFCLDGCSAASILYSTVSAFPDPVLSVMKERCMRTKYVFTYLMLFVGVIASSIGLLESARKHGISLDARTAAAVRGGQCTSQTLVSVAMGCPGPDVQLDTCSPGTGPNCGDLKCKYSCDRADHRIGDYAASFNVATIACPATTDQQRCIVGASNNCHCVDPTANVVCNWGQAVPQRRAVCGV